MTSFEFENGGCNGRSGSGAAVLILSFFLQGSSSSALEGEWCSGWSPSQVIIPQPSQTWTLSEEKDSNSLSQIRGGGASGSFLLLLSFPWSSHKVGQISSHVLPFKLSIILSCVFTDNFGSVKLSYILCTVYIVETNFWVIEHREFLPPSHWWVFIASAGTPVWH